jgi:hypothetical protein
MKMPSILTRPGQEGAGVSTALRRRWTSLAAWLSARLAAGGGWWVAPLMAFAVTRGIVMAAAYLGEIALPGNVGDGYWHVAPGNLFVDLWARWDSGFYLSIVQQGYAYSATAMSNVAFFPVYPLLVSLVKTVTGDAAVAGVLVSNASLLAALLFLYKLTELEFGDADTAQRAVFYIAAFPTAFFFSAIYTESTFLLFSVATMYFARRHLWMWAGVMGMMTSATRIVGVTMAGIVVLEWLRVHGWTIAGMLRKESWVGLWNELRRDSVSLLPVLLIPLGILSYMLFLKLQFNDPLAFWTVQAAWQRENLGPLAIIWRALSGLLGQNFLSGEIWWHVIVDLGSLALALLLMIPVWRRLGEHYALLIALGMLVPVASSTQSLSRYLLVLFPVFMMLAWWGRRRLLDRSLLVIFATLLGVFTTIFVNWIFLA